MSAERERVRDLARRVAEAAADPAMEAIRRRWRDVNALRRPDRAPVWCRPVGCWKEILPPESLCCADPYLRGLEHHFQQTLWKHELGDDSPVEPFFDVGVAMSVDPPSLWGVPIRHRPSGVVDGAWAYDPPLKEPADYDRLCLPRFTIDLAATGRAMDRAHALLGDLLPVRRVGGAPISATLGTYAADLRGLETMMFDMAAEPALMHRLMALLRDAALGAMDVVEQAGLVTPNNEGPMTTSDPVDAPDADGRWSFRNTWCMANSQEFDQVSPAMWEEFCLDYQRPIFARCGLVGYGCCENLTHKIDGVLSIPNLRIFVCSAWTDLGRVIDAVAGRACIMWRQKASDVVFARDEAELRRDLREGARRLQGHPYQIVLRELQTLAGHPDRLHVWTRLAREAAEEFA
jgi:hypothetical protein